jgi:hypothetical protein
MARFIFQNTLSGRESSNRLKREDEKILEAKRSIKRLLKSFKGEMMKA